jgi:putative DNA primase/helicase
MTAPLFEPVETPSASDPLSQHRDRVEALIKSNSTALGLTLDPFDEDNKTFATLLDNPLAEIVARQFENGLVWTITRGWLRWSGRVWEPLSDPGAVDMVRVALRLMYQDLTSQAESIDQAKAFTVLLSKTKAASVAFFLRGMMERPGDIFDARPDLLNVNNGVVHLPTGNLLEHKPELYLTKITPVDYQPDRYSSDWEAALTAVPKDVQPWFQMWMGQAATGHTPDKDQLPIMQGSGSNGKSTVLAAVQYALGDHAVIVPERVLMANPGDHPTEMTQLQGARMAIIEETPEGRHLPTKRLKDLIGTPTMTARRMYKDNETWKATHTLFLATNYRPLVAETDHGTWRRLALVTFPYTFRGPGEPLQGDMDRRGDSGLRRRLMADPRAREAVLAWIVEGARRWYFAGMNMRDTPDDVILDTEEWRAETDLILAYVNDNLEFDPNSAVAASELFADFSVWLEDSRHSNWSDSTFTSRFAEHDSVKGAGVKKARPKTPPPLSRKLRDTPPITGRPHIWTGVRFATSA